MFHGKGGCSPRSSGASQVRCITPVQAASVGASHGEFSVSPTGAATYSTPIAVPPATAGMEPNLVLSNSSQTGDSFAGTGWSLSGLSAVTRSPSPLSQDGGVLYDSDDKFRLDAQRLIAVNGTCGADLTEYRAEIENFTRGISHGPTHTSHSGSKPGPSPSNTWNTARKYGKGHLQWFQRIKISTVMKKGHGWYLYLRQAVALVAACVALTFLAPDCFADITASREAGLAYLILQQTGAGNWRPAAGQEVAATSEALSAFWLAGMRASAPYARGVAWLANADASSIDSLARKIIALKQADMNVAAFDANLLTGQSYPTGYVVGTTYNYASGYLWGAYPGYGVSYPDTSLALAANRLANGGYGDLSQPGPLGVAIYCEILRSQRGDGGWSYSSNASSTGSSDPSVTYNSALIPSAYTLLELKQVSLATGWTTSSTCGTSYSLPTAIPNALAFIWSKYNNDGGFGDNGSSSALETALAYRVIHALAPTDSRVTNALNWLVGHQNQDGSWPGGSFVTAAVLASLDPITLPNVGPDGIPQAVKALLPANYSAPDARNLASGNGQSVAGLTVPLAVANEIVLNQPYSVALPAYGGTTPYSWTLGSGVLPPGLSLNAATGVISGTPTQLGNYSFSYIVTDSSSPPLSQETIGSISVYVSPPSLADGDINGDGTVDVADYQLAERFALGLAVPTTPQAQHADVYPAGAPDGVIDMRDVILIRNKALGFQ